MGAKEDLYAELKSATKRANQRLVRLEQRDEKTFAYQKAENDIRNILGKETGKVRFDVRKNMSFGEMEKQLKYANKFNNSVSSTVSGIKKTIKKRDKTILKKYGTKDMSALYRIFASESYHKAIELLPSSMVVQAVSDAINQGMSSDTIEDKLTEFIKSENDGYLIDRMNELLGADLEDVDI